ncbi:OmpA family protein [Plectonema cf. radiosum LEGE 06105]|uniref:OmpA family protein n=1 Tax=Plectonema cf. radiosum LEGE 06105 TaxID=945769 RepID=A0A8J7F867_9CYAN|nr:OmpA family protein [Plectonema radiosum]MBE9211133.1 OmpA family protein [Plectonema cf. radiosum LEGE 06105]
MNNYNGNRLAEEPLKNHHNNHIKENNQFNELDELNELTELRSLLLGIEQPKLDKFYQKLDNPQVDAEDISKMLPEAIILRTMKDDQLSEAMIPTVEQAIESSVKKDINILSQAIFPIIGPATRKAIATTLDEMLQSFNRALEYSASPQSLKWRIEARQTGKSFAEVVLLRTLIYRVEQVFLIHKHSGLILQHIVASKVAAQDPSLVSAMLTAIQDFVRDSFEVRKHEGLHTLEFGELTIWIEEGPTAVLAGIIRGNAPEELRIVFKNVLEKIHLKLSKEIENFSGDTQPFVPSKPYLENCLESHYRNPTNTKYTYAWLSVTILTIVLGIWGFNVIRDNQRWNNYVKILADQPGILVTKTDTRNGKYLVTGMRDPLAVEPNQFMKQLNINEKAVVYQWKPFISLEPEIIVKRAENFLQKPKTVTFTLDDKGVLNATGFAPREWILSARQQQSSLSILGINQYQDENLTNLDIEQLNTYKKEIEEIILLFENNTTQFLPGETEKLLKLLPKLQNLIDAAKSLEKDIFIEIDGYANSLGDKQANIKLSQNRAEKILTYLTSQGINKNYFRTKSLDSENILRPESTEEEKKLNRRVSFKVIIDDITKYK